MGAYDEGEMVIIGEELDPVESESDER